jgi:hypothetical protein
MDDMAGMNELVITRRGKTLCTLCGECVHEATPEGSWLSEVILAARTHLTQKHPL